MAEGDLGRLRTARRELRAFTVSVIDVDFEQIATLSGDDEVDGVSWRSGRAARLDADVQWQRLAGSKPTCRRAEE